MPLFNKQEHELETHFDKWVYFLKHVEVSGVNYPGRVTTITLAGFS
jgi:hypothetical protein